MRAVQPPDALPRLEIGDADGARLVEDGGLPPRHGIKIERHTAAAPIGKHLLLPHALLGNLDLLVDLPHHLVLPRVCAAPTTPQAWQGTRRRERERGSEGARWDATRRFRALSRYGSVACAPLTRAQPPRSPLSRKSSRGTVAASPAPPASPPRAPVARRAPSSSAQPPPEHTGCARCRLAWHGCSTKSRAVPETLLLMHGRSHLLALHLSLLALGFFPLAPLATRLAILRHGWRSFGPAARCGENPTLGAAHGAGVARRRVIASELHVRTCTCLLLMLRQHHFGSLQQRVQFVERHSFSHQ